MQAHWFTPALFSLLWLPAMIAASYSWRFGEYYAYGWFVPPAALGLLLWRWRTLGQAPAKPLPTTWFIAAFCILLPWFLVLRILGHADPSWRMPMLLLAATATISSHALIAYSYGWKISSRFVWITLLLLSAVPWPTVLEKHIVLNLTDAVIHTVSEWFQITGRPVVMAGDRLLLHDMNVEVSDGCSGVRSFQSFVMATWFFAEAHRMRASRVAILLACACAAAFIVNTVRAWALATIRFDHGVDAFDRAHDWLGLLAFAVSGLFFYFLSGYLSREEPQNRVLRRTKK